MRSSHTPTQFRILLQSRSEAVHPTRSRAADYATALLPEVNTKNEFDKLDALPVAPWLLGLLPLGARPVNCSSSFCRRIANCCPVTKGSSNSALAKCTSSTSIRVPSFLALQPSSRSEKKFCGLVAKVASGETPTQMILFLGKKGYRSKV